MCDNMFEWKKDVHGCNCCPVPIGGEKYILHIGRLFTGKVKSLHNKYKDPKNISSWEAEVWFIDHMITGQGGGNNTRDEYMLWVEKTIHGCIKEINDSLLCKPGNRVIRDILYDTNQDTGKLEQKVLEYIYEKNK